MLDKKNKIITHIDAKMTRPIQTINKKCYIATNVQMQMADKSKRYCWIIASADGEERYSEVELEGFLPFDKAPFHIDMAGTPRPGSTISYQAFEKYILKRESTPTPAETFKAVAENIDRFVSFDGSFASQEDMVDFLTCWTISTYATDAFQTVGYIWPNGERGSGKTQCLKAVMAVSNMGLTVTASSTFASIRDEAALGGTLGFDDCENLQKTEPSKRELLLAGNTKEATFLLKEPGKRDGDWNTKYIDCFAPRAFTSIGIPDDVLLSRTILIPLTRTSDTIKTRRKPTNVMDWKTPPSTLRDLLTITVARDLHKFADFEAEINTSSEITGRDFDIFQPILMAAWWLQQSGVEGLFGRMLEVMNRYHSTKHKNTLPSFEHITLQAISDLLTSGPSPSSALSTRDIASQMMDVCRRWDVTDPELTTPDVQRVGTLLGRLGFRKSPSHAKVRSWAIKLEELLERSRSAGITLELLQSEEVSQEAQGMHRFQVRDTGERGPIPW